MADTQPKILWVEYTHQDGRKYYYHSQTRQTVWQKPDELKTPKERLLETSPWKEYTSPEGKKYYHNAVSKETVWTVPEDYKSLLDELAEETKAKEAVAAAAAAATPPQSHATPKPLTPTSSSAVSTPSPLRHQAIMPGSQPSPLQHNPPQQQISPQQQQQSPLSMRDHAGQDSMRNNAPPFLPPQNSSSRPPYPHQHGPRPPRFQQSFVPPEGSQDRGRDRGRERNVNEIPEFRTKEEAEVAFKSMLKETGVTSTWTWEQTMRAVVTNPMYRALKTTAERKTAFQEYVDDRRIQEKQEEQVRQQTMKQDFLDLLKSNDKVTHASRYTTISRLFAEEPAFKAITDDRLRYKIFDGYVGELIRQEKEEARQKRKAGMAALLTLLQSIDEITLMTRWAEARDLLQERKEYQESETIKGLAKVDLLTVYEDYVKHLENEYEQKRARERALRKRAERKRREVFKELLTELRSKGYLNAKTCWMQIHPLIKDDARYLDMLGQPGSSPMELFWDLIEDLDEKLYQDRKMIQDVLRNIDYEILPESTFEEFQASLSNQENTSGIPSEDLKLIFEQLLGKAIHHAKEEKRRQEKLTRKKAESFKIMLKTLNPAVTVESNWENVKAKVEQTPEYIALETDEKRKEVFDRYIERLKERIAKNYDSDDEDGFILEDDADYHSKRASSDRKRPASSSKYHESSSSHHHGSHPSIGDRHRRSAKTSTHSRNSLSNGKHDRGDAVSGESGAEDDAERKAKKSKTADDNESATASKAAPSSTGAAEEGEVIEAPAPQ